MSKAFCLFRVCECVWLGWQTINHSWSIVAMISPLTNTNYDCGTDQVYGEIKSALWPIRMIHTIPSRWFSVLTQRAVLLASPFRRLCRPPCLSLSLSLSPSSFLFFVLWMRTTMWISLAEVEFLPLEHIIDAIPHGFRYIHQIFFKFQMQKLYLNVVQFCWENQ